MPSTNGNRPDAPTRLAEARTNIGDRFITLVHHKAEVDLFLTIDKSAIPDGLDWVVVELHNDRIILELYDGQDFVGTANILEFYKLTNSEQWRPQIRNRFTNW